MHILLIMNISICRTSFAFWILANIMMVTVVFYGAFLLTLTGVTMIFACVTFHVLQPRLPFRILGSDVDFVTYYGPCFWAVLIFGEFINMHLCLPTCMALM